MSQRRSKRARPPANKVQTKSFVLKGGLNLTGAPIAIPDGMLLAGINYEPLIEQGYRRLSGFERYDGRSKPTDATYWILNYDGGTIAFAEGNTVTGLTSGYTSKVLSVWGTTASGYLVVTNATGVYQDNEDLRVGGVTNALANGTATPRGASTPALDATYAQDAIETQRALIEKVGLADGSGPVRGVQEYNTDLYAFRNNAAGTQGLLWKATTAGWVQQALGRSIAFTSGGTYVVAEGNTITGAVSGATAVITRVVLTSGTWAAGDAAGRLIFASQTGTFQAENLNVGANLDVSTIAGNSTAITIPAGGAYEFVNYNFYGTSGTYRMYGVNGVGTAFEWDGTVFVPIITGNTNDTPTHLEVNEYHLMLCFEKGSLQNSATGNPYLWVGGGAAEIGTGSVLIGLKKEVGGALFVLCDKRTLTLYGKNTVDSPWDLRTVDDAAGGLEWTLQRIGATRYLDDRGFTSVQAAQEYGDFSSSVYSQLIEPLILSKKDSVVSSVLVRSKSQYRIFFDDGTGIIATFNANKLSGFGFIRYLDANSASVIVRCTTNGKDSSDKEVIFFGDDSGYVYQMDQGTSFDGGAVDASLILSYSNCGSPMYDKEFHKVVMEAIGSAGTDLNYNVLLDYSTGSSPSGITFLQALSSGGAVWDQFIWDQANWASDDVTLIEGNIDGVGRNIALQISSSSTYTEPHTLFAVTYQYILRTLRR